MPDTTLTAPEALIRKNEEALADLKRLAASLRSQHAQSNEEARQSLSELKPGPPPPPARM